MEQKTVYTSFSPVKRTAQINYNRRLLKIARLESFRPVRRAALAAVALAIAVPAWAQASAVPAYPAKPVRLVIGTTAGGITDFLGRTLAERLAAVLSQPVIVENKPGATGNVAIEFVAKSSADGYTLLLVAGGNIVIAPFLYRALPVDPLTALAPVFNVAEAPQLLVVPGSLPVRDLREFIAFARGRPGKINYASAGVGSTTHLAGDHFARLAGLDLVHVPYKGIGQALADLLAGRVQMLSVGLEPVRKHLDTGALRALAVGSNQRLAAAPGVPTAAEAGLPGYEMTTWFGIFAPAGTRPEVVGLLNASLQTALDDPRLKQRLVEAGIAPLGGPAREFAERVRADARVWERVVRDAGIRLE
jgi:tripartite-type tricarboxylate transporter receptor subunit TctC